MLPVSSDRKLPNLIDTGDNSLYTQPVTDENLKEFRFQNHKMTLQSTLPNLLPPLEMPSLPGLRVPADFYLVTCTPAPLAGMIYPPPGTPWSVLHDLGLRHVVSLHSDPRRLYDPAPLLMLSSIHLQDLYDGVFPGNPKEEAGLIGLAVRVALEALVSGQGVLVHCAGGIGRSGTVIGCLLARLGLPPRAAIDYLHQLNQARGHRGWPESPWQAEMVERFATTI